MYQNKKTLNDIFNDDPFGLLNVKPNGSNVMNPDERLVSSFEEINAFFEKHNREPEASNGVQEYQLSARLKGLRSDTQKVEMLQQYDRFDLLETNQKPISNISDIFNDDSFGLLDNKEDSIFNLKHVSKETKMPDYIASRKPCQDFEKFEHLFITCQQDIKLGKRKLYPFKNEQQIDKGYFFVLKGILLYVTEISEREKMSGKINARLRCIFENGTESDMLLRSLAAELYKEGRRVTEHDEKFLDNFSGVTNEDEETGFVYVLKSLSDNQEIKSIHNLFKIGFSKISVEERIKNAAQEPTYLMAPVSIVTTFKCFNMNPQKLELLLHTFFGKSCLNLDVFDKEGKRFMPREWFIAPLAVIEQAIHLMLTGEIIDFKYDSEKCIIIGK